MSEKQEVWNQQNEIIERVYNLGAEGVFKNIPNIKQAFAGSDLNLHEVHEGVAEYAGNDKHTHARVAYYDGTGKFNWSSIKGLPEGFVINRNKHHSAIQRMQECIDRAFNKTGFDGMFSEEWPFLIIVLGDPSNRSLHYDLLQVEVSKLAEGNGKIKIDGFDVPKEWLN